MTILSVKDATSGFAHDAAEKGKDGETMLLVGDGVAGNPGPQGAKPALSYRSRVRYGTNPRTFILSL
jgi:hypothetical protein